MGSHNSEKATTDKIPALLHSERVSSSHEDPTSIPQPLLTGKSELQDERADFPGAYGYYILMSWGHGNEPYFNFWNLP